MDPLTIGLLLGGTALSAIGGFGQANAAKDAASRNKTILNGLKTEGMGYIDQGAGQAGDYLNRSLSLTDLGQNANGLYSDALGINGQPGADRAMSAFQTGPGYQFAVDQSMKALERRGSSLGLGQSGNTLAALSDRAGQMANQEYQTWLGNLNTGINRNVATLGDLATLGQNTAGQKLDLAGTVAGGLTSASNQRASGEQAAWGTLGNIGSSLTGALGGYGRF